MRDLVFASAVLVCAASAPALADPIPGRPDVIDSSTVQPSGERILQEEILIRAPRSAVWSALATSEGLKSWQMPVAAIDLRVGGYLEGSYDRRARLGDPNNIKHEILTYVLERMLVERIVQTPRGFPHPELFSQVTSVLILDDAADGWTRVTQADVGYGRGADWDRLYADFRRGDAWVLEKLKAHLEGTDKPRRGKRRGRR